MEWNLDAAFEFAGKEIRVDVYGKDYLTQYLDIIERYTNSLKAVKVLEWGAGLTTIAVLKNRERLRVSELYSIENNKDYMNAVNKCLPSADFRVVYQDVIGSCNDQHDQGLNYSMYPSSLNIQFDVILIDGRRRMECAFNALTLGDGSQTVIIHDYRRERYQLVRHFYDIIEDGRQFRVTRPKQGIANALGFTKLNSTGPG